MPQIRSADPLYPLVTKALEESDNPQTCESSKQSFVVQETQDGVVLDFEHFTVVIRNKDQHT